MMRRSCRRASRDDRGFTLVEVLITISISGVILGAVSMGLLFSLRVQGPTAERLNDSRYKQVLSAWLPSDLASADAVGGADTTASTSAGCATEVAGTNALRLVVTDDSTGAITYISYRVVESGGLWQLTRTTCLAGAPASTRLLVNGLASSSAVTVTPAMTSTSTVGSVSMTVATTTSGETNSFIVVGQPRASAAAATVTTVAPAGSPTTVVAPTTTTTTTVPTTTTTTVPATTTTVPATTATTVPTTTTTPPCVVTSASPASVAKKVGSVDLLNNYTFFITVTGTCSSTMAMVLTPGANNPAQVTLTLSTSGATRSKAVSKTLYDWTSGAKTVTITNNGVAIYTFTLTVN